MDRETGTGVETRGRELEDAAMLTQEVGMMEVGIAEVDAWKRVVCTVVS